MLIPQNIVSNRQYYYSSSIVTSRTSCLKKRMSEPANKRRKIKPDEAGLIEMEQLRKEYDELKIEHSFYKTMYERNVAKEIDPAEVEVMLNKVAPSAIKWDTLEKAGFVPSFDQFLNQLPALGDTPADDPSAIETASQLSSRVALLRMEELILKNSQPSNEGFATLVWGNIFAFATQQLNDSEAEEEESNYLSFVSPVIHAKPEDHRHDLKSDYTIVHLKNHITYVVCELKLMTGVNLSYSDRNGIAQLLYEVKLVSNEENPGIFIGIYASCDVAHFFYVDTTSVPFKILSYTRLINSSGGTITNHLLSLLKNLPSKTN